MNIRHPLRGKRKRGDTAQLAAQLAPLEEQNAQSAEPQPGSNGRSANHGASHTSLIQERGALILDTDSISLMQGLGEGKGRRGQFLGIEPIVLYILIGALIFIAFIAWQISQMPKAE